MDLTEAESIKKRWQEYRRTVQKDLNDPDNHDGVITHLQPDILESSQLGLKKWLVEVMEFELSYFKS